MIWKSKILNWMFLKSVTNLLDPSVGECSGIVPALLNSSREKAIEDVINGHIKQLSTSYARFSISGFSSYLLLIKISQFTCSFFFVLCKQQAHFRRGYLSHTHGLLINYSTRTLIMHLFCHLCSSCLRSLIIFFARKTEFSWCYSG